MKRNWQPILFAVLLGILLPALTLRLGRMLTEPHHEPPQADSRPSTMPSSGSVAQIPVLMGQTVVQMDLDAYLVGVVLAEMPASFETEALKAQAVAARTYALKRIREGDKHPQGGVCTDFACCQAYISVEDYLLHRGDQEDVNKITDAVCQTSGQVLTYKGKLAEATYFSCSGGRTEDAAAVWGSDIPYLQSVESPGEEAAAGYTKTVSFTREKFANALDRKLTGSPEQWLGTVTMSEGGGVSTMVIAGKSYTGVQLRKLLGLNSTAFSMTVVDGRIQIVTRGHGHRVGMSQYGADAMAVTGSTYLEILNHYYPGTGIDKMDAIG